MRLSPEKRIRPAELQDETLRLAQDELLGFLRKSVGIARSADGEIALDFIIANDATYSVRATSDTLTFSGATSVDALHAVYHFAEDFLGFCFFEPGSDRLTGRAPVSLPEGKILQPHTPLLKRRGFVQEFPFSDDNYRLADWMARNRLNYLLTWMKYYDEMPAKMRDYYRVRGIDIESGHHNFEYWIPAAKYYKDHPEYFAIVNGKRVEFTAEDKAHLLSKQLCASNPDVRAEIAKNMVSYCRAHPELKYISLIPNDGFGWCECERCSKFYDKNVRGEFYCLSEHVYVANALYHDMVRDVAARLHRELPDVILTFGAYVNYVEPAPGFSLNSSLAVHFAPYWRCINHAVNDPACPANSRYMQSLAKWRAVKDAGEINIYEYYMGVNLYMSLPMVHHEAIFDELRALAGAGADGILTQFHLSHWTAYGLNFYMMAKAAYGDSRRSSVARALEDVFGNDAAMARRFYDELRALLLSAAPCHIPYPRSLFRRTEVAQYENMLALAKALLARKPDDTFRRNLVTWAEYLLRFKKSFDLYMSGQDARESIAGLHSWINSHLDSGVFVPRNVEAFFPAWLAQIARGKPWYHFNIEWEDAYIKQHDKQLST